MIDISKADWKLFREKLPLWQERYMERLCKEYVEILFSDKDASERFWTLEKRIKNDRKAPGVILSMSKSEMTGDIIRLIQDNVITLEEIAGFSETLQAEVKSMILHLRA